MATLPLFDREPRGDKRDNGGKKDRVLRVSQVNRMVRMLLEDRFAQVWVEGELSDVTRAASGHVYFTLNDEDEPAQLRGVIFRSDAQRAKARLVDGARVKLRGSLSLFEPRGGFQLIARIALPYGLGELHAQFEAVRKRLSQAGLLDPARKRPLPRLPRVLGVVTSLHGAALSDIARVAQARCPVRIVVAPCRVQGPEAPRSIAAAIGAIGELPALDAVIVGRGGGAAEDLFAFNDERVARAIAACPVPVVSAVGHEVDVTIADLVADVRAATPSNAAELCVPDRRALALELSDKERALLRALEVALARKRLSLDRAAHKLHEPRALLRGTRQRLGALDERSRDVMEERLRAARQRLRRASERLHERDPRLWLAAKRRGLHDLAARLRGVRERLVQAPRARLSALVAALEALSPLSILARGYAIALHADTGRALLRDSDAQPGDIVELRLHRGGLRTRVEGHANVEAGPSATGHGPTAGNTPGNGDSAERHSAQSASEASHGAQRRGGAHVSRFEESASGERARTEVRATDGGSAPREEEAE